MSKTIFDEMNEIEQESMDDVKNNPLHPHNKKMIMKLFRKLFPKKCYKTCGLFKIHKLGSIREVKK